MEMQMEYTEEYIYSVLNKAIVWSVHSFIGIDPMRSSHASFTRIELTPYYWNVNRNLNPVTLIQKSFGTL